MTQSLQNHIEIDSASAWTICAGSVIVTVLECGTFKSLGVMLPDLQQQFLTPTWVIGFIVSMKPGLGVITGPLVGAVSKRFTPRYTVMAFGMLAACALILSSIAPNVYTLALLIIINGFSFGIEPIAYAVVPDYFDKYYDIAVAIVGAGGGVGIMIMPMLTQFLLNVYGWRGTVWIIGALNLHSIVFGALLRPPKSKKVPIEIEQQEERDTILHNLDLSLFRRYNFVSMVFFSIGVGYIVSGWTIYLVPHALDIGFQPYEAAALASFGGAGYTVGSLIFPLLTKIFSSKRILYVSTFWTSAVLLIDPISSAFCSYAGILFSCVAFNVGRAIFSVILFKMVKQDVHEDKQISAVAWLFSGMSVGMLLSGFSSGWFFDQTGSYTWSFVILSVVPLLGLCPTMISDILQCIRPGLTRYSSVPMIDSDKG